MSPRVCEWCGRKAPLVHVHGHAQCALCGVNVEPCCQGGETAPASSPAERRPEPGSLQLPPS